MDHGQRRERLAARLSGLEADGFLVTHLPNVRYLTGFTGSNAQLLVTPVGGLFLTDGRYLEQSRHEVPDFPREAYTSGSGLQRVARACAEAGGRRVAFESAWLTHQSFVALGESGVDLVPSIGEVERLRRVKDPEERLALEEAQAIADQALEVALGKLVEGVTERGLALDLDVTMRGLGAEAVSFDTIVAFGENGAEPHHAPTDRPLRTGEMVKLDFGSVVRGYHSDMTRTVAFGRPPAVLAEVYEVVRQAQAAGVAAVREGVPCGDVDRATRDPIEQAGFGEQYLHPCGHGVGLEIHEEPWLRKGADDLLPAGAVVTVEPGIYLEGVGGVRIEDMVEVRADGGRVLAGSTKDLVVL